MGDSDGDDSDEDPREPEEGGEGDCSAEEEGGSSSEEKGSCSEGEAEEEKRRRRRRLVEHSPKGRERYLEGCAWDTRSTPQRQQPKRSPLRRLQGLRPQRLLRGRVGRGW